MVSDKMNQRIQIVLLALAFALSGGVRLLDAQVRPKAKTAQKSGKATVNNAKAPAKGAKAAAASKAQAGRKFVLDVVELAVSLPQPDPQDRLRVLHSAATVLSAIAPKRSAQLAGEGVRIEADLVALGQKPAVSAVASGYAKCSDVAAFVNRIYPANLVAAEQALVGAVTRCQKSSLEAVRARAEAAMQQNIVAPRLIMALVDVSGAKSPWAQRTFETMIGSLPSASEATRKEAPNYAAMYANMARVVEKSLAKSTGIKMLEWIAKLPESGEKAMAAKISSGAMQEALGAEAYTEALAGNVIAKQTAEIEGGGAVERAEEESSSVLEAMRNTGTEQTDRLRQLPASLRAREAAAHGFASGTGGDGKAAESYFDMAFSALNEVWSARSPEKDVAAIVEEVASAAAHVDSVDALTRAQALQDPTAQAIGMIAVARVVMGSSL